jgi:hypothetical protein
MKNCNGSYCDYKLADGKCKYDGYCDYQTPRDSRMQPIMPIPYIGDLGAEQTCPYCGLKLSQCRGHVTCP